MFRSIALRRIVAGTLIVCLLSFVACERREATDVTAPGTATKPDIVAKGEFTSGHAYMCGNPFHERRLGVLFRRADVSAAVEDFVARGFRLSPEASFTIWGTEGEKTILVTFIAFVGDARSATILCREAGNAFVVSPVVFATDKPAGEPGWRPFIGKGWYNAPGPGPFNRSSQRSNATDWWDWGSFGNCIADLAPAAAAGCAVQCIYVPGYWQCFLICVTAEALAATLTCIFQMYRGDGGGPRDQVREEECLDRSTDG